MPPRATTIRIGGSARGNDRGRAGGDHATHNRALTPLKSWAVILTGTFVTVAAGAWFARKHLEPAWYFGEPQFYERTVFPHAAAMTAVVALALLVIAPLLRANLPVVAFFVAGSIAFGPLSLLAAPMFTIPDSYENPRTIESVFPWVVGAVVTGLLLVAAHHLNGTSTPVRKPSVVGLTLIGALMVLPLLTLPALLAGEDDLFEYPTFFPLGQALIVTGMALLAGGLMTVGLLAVDRPLNSVLRLRSHRVGPCSWALGVRPGRRRPEGSRVGLQRKPAPDLRTHHHPAHHHRNHRTGAPRHPHSRAHEFPHGRTRQSSVP